MALPQTAEILSPEQNKVTVPPVKEQEQKCIGSDPQ